MNVRLAAHSLRCRITNAELDRLLGKRDVVLDVSLPPMHTLRISLRTTPIGSWKLDSDPTGVWLTVPHTELEALSASLPQREGLHHAFATGGGDLEVIVDVDVRPT
jgi:hypothetical protein